jgi:hypothetical protein
MGAPLRLAIEGQQLIGPSMCATLCAICAVVVQL